MGGSRNWGRCLNSLWRSWFGWYREFRRHPRDDEESSEGFVEGYGRHVSDHVTRKRREAAAGAGGRAGEAPASTPGPEVPLELLAASRPRLSRRSRARRG